MWTPSLTVLVLLRLALSIVPTILRGAGVLQLGWQRLDQAREEFERLTGNYRIFERIPLSEGSLEYLETFVEDHASCIQLLRDQLIRLEKRQALIFIFTDAVEMVFEDFELLKSLEEKGKLMHHDIIHWVGDPVTGAARSF